MLCSAMMPGKVGRKLMNKFRFKIEGEDIPMLRSVVPVSTGGKGYFVESFVDLSGSKKYN